MQAELTEFLRLVRQLEHEAHMLVAWPDSAEHKAEVIRLVRVVRAARERLMKHTCDEGRLFG